MTSVTMPVRQSNRMPPFQVLQLMNLTDSRLPQMGCEKLELSMMSFLDHIRKIYIIEQMQKMKIYKRL